MPNKALIESIQKNVSDEELSIALSELETSGTPSNLKSIIQFVNHKTPAVASIAKRTSSTIIRKALLEDFASFDKPSREKLTLLLDMLHPDIISELMNDINCSHESAQLNAIMVIGLLPNRIAAKAVLEKILALGGVKLRATALNAIVDLIGKDDLAIIVQRLQDEDSRVRANAVEALQKLGEVRKNKALHGQITADRIMASLKRVRHDEDSRVRANVLKAIFMLGEHNVTEDLVKMLGSSNDRMVISALWVVEEIGATEDKICATIKLLRRHSSPKIRQAVKILAGKPGFIYNLEYTEYEVMEIMDELDFQADGLEHSLTYYRFSEIAYESHLEVMIGLILFARNCELLLQIWSLPPGKMLSVSFNHKMFSFFSGVNPTWVNENSITMTLFQFEVALLVKNQNLIDTIAAFDITRLLAKKNNLVDQTELHLRNSYLLMYAQDDGWEEEFSRAQKCAVRRPKQFNSDLTLKKEFLKAISSKDQAIFDKMCSVYLGRYERSRHRTQNNSLPWDTSVLFFLGWATFAVETYGLQFTGTNEYAPRWLLDGKLLSHPLVMEYNERDASIVVEHTLKR